MPPASYGTDSGWPARGDQLQRKRASPLTPGFGLAPNSVAGTQQSLSTQETNVAKTPKPVKSGKPALAKLEKKQTLKKVQPLTVFS